MKQEVSSYLFTFKDTLYELSKYIYNNPEDSFHEYKASSYIKKILKEHNFKVTDNFLQIPTSFYAEFGSGHPKICYLCEYDAVQGSNHAAGHNLISAMSIGAGISLSKIIGKLKGTVVIIGCPGELVGSSKVTMAKQGIFDDIDTVLMAHPDTVTAESGMSLAVLPISIKFKGENGFSYLKSDGYSPLDANIFTFTGLNLLMKGFTKDICIDGVINNGGLTHALSSDETEARFFIRASTMKSALLVENKIRELVNTASLLTGMKSNISLYELPYEELISNPTLSRIFSHNLKECGIIDCVGVKNTDAGLSIGTVSHKVPCIHPYISIVEDSKLSNTSNEFQKACISDYAHEISLKTAQALALTGIDLLMNETLLSEIKSEFFKSQESLTK